MSVDVTTGQSYSALISVPNTPADAFAAVTNIRGWWSAEVNGETAQLGDVFVFEVPGVHRCTMTLTQLVPNERVVWRVSDSCLSFIEDTSEWDGTEVMFDISEANGATQVRFTHVGLASAAECYDVCSDAWGSYITGSLRSLITTGTGDPHRAGGTFESEVAKHEANKAKD